MDPRTLSLLVVAFCACHASAGAPVESLRVQWRLPAACTPFATPRVNDLKEELRRTGYRLVIAIHPVEGSDFEKHEYPPRDLYVVAADGAGLRQLTDTAQREEHAPRVSPNGKHFTYNYGDYIVDAGTRETREIWGGYACRAGTETAYCFGNDRSTLKRHAWFKANATRGPRPVEARQPNPWGLHDMYGNVWEWCHDFYGEDYYRHSPERDPAGPDSGKLRVLRGGCWNSRPDACRSSYRNSEDPGYTDVCFGADVHGFVGFRCVRREP